VEPTCPRSSPTSPSHSASSSSIGVYAITAIVSMALGIAATAAVYSLLYGVLIDPYPYRDANRIAMINLHDKRGDEGSIPFTLAEIQQLAGRNRLPVCWPSVTSPGPRPTATCP
jgi:hypothetical protein